MLLLVRLAACATYLSSPAISRSLLQEPQPALSTLGWSLGADVEYVMAENSGWFGQEAIKPAVDVIALIYNRSGVTIGGSVEGIKYSPIYKN